MPTQPPLPPAPPPAQPPPPPPPPPPARPPRVRRSKFMRAAGTLTLIQAAVTAVVASLAIAQYFCLIDFLHTYPLLIYIKILYFANPSSCDTQINIGQSIDGIADQAFVLISREPLTTYRTFVISCVGLGLSILWAIGSIFSIRTSTHWPWATSSLLMAILDFVGLVTAANDSFHTKTLTDVMAYIGATVSGVGRTRLYTGWAAWAMVFTYARFGLLPFFNVPLMITAILISKCGRRDGSMQLEMTRTPAISVETIEKDSDRDTSSSSEERTRIPRPGLSRAFRTMKNFLFIQSAPGSARGSPYGGRTRQRVNSPGAPSVQSMIAAEQRRLNLALIELEERGSPARHRRRRLASSFTYPAESTSGQQGTNAELQAQKPWSYMPATSRMRDQLPPDEDLPPVPLPDYTAFHSARKASVHRAASSLSSITQRKEHASYQSPRREQRTQFDVLY